MKKIKAGIIGPGNIGTDLMYKIMKSSNLEMKLMAGIVESEGIKRAAGLGFETSIRGVDAVAADDEIRIVFDATSAKAHLHNAPILKQAGKIVMDMTPAAVGPYVVPCVNLDSLPSDTDNFNIISFIYSVIDFYDSGSNFMSNIYTDDKAYNLEHFVVPKRSSAIVDWVYGWKENRKGKVVPQIKKIHLDTEKSKRYRKKITDYLIIDKDLNGSFECFDIVEKVEAIKKWHDAREAALPRHIQTYFDYLTDLDSFRNLEELKANNEQDVSKIESVYLQFVEEYFDGIELSQNIMDAFKNSF